MILDQISLGGHWAVAALMIVVASWIIFRTLIPKSLKEWRNAGLLQAFIIALYAEMYGFPLTIYVLTSLLGFDIPWLHMKGHLWATLLGFGTFGALIEMVIGFSSIILGLILLLRGWKQIYQARKEDRLITTDLYQYVRHPQYTGIFLALFGQLIHWPTFLTVLLFRSSSWHTIIWLEKKRTDWFTDLVRFMKTIVGRYPCFFPDFVASNPCWEGKLRFAHSLYSAIKWEAYPCVTP